MATTTKKEKMEATEITDKYIINYVIHIHDNHGTINIKQSGQPDEPPPDPNE